MAIKNLEAFNKIANDRGVVSHSVENGVVRMKILVKREELQNVIQQVTNKKGENSKRDNVISLRPTTRPLGSKSLEQRVKDMKRMRSLSRLRQMKGDCRRYWRPALESIPEAGVLAI